MADPAVHWHEGMLLRPQHFQTADRHWQDQLRCATRWGQAYHWGVRSIRLDAEQLRAGFFSVRGLEARLRNGTVVQADEGELTDVNLRVEEVQKVLALNKPVEIALAVPALRLGEPNEADSPSGSNDGTGGEDTIPRRFRVKHPQGNFLADENTGVPAQKGDVRVRQLTLRLLHAGEDPAGYETLPLARVVRSEGAEFARLDPSFIPPLLACNAWPPLHQEILQKLDSRVKVAVEDTVKRARDVARFGSSSPDQTLLLEKFRLMNETWIFLRVFVRAAGVHPFDAYTELCRLLGRLAVLGKGLPLIEPPLYDHDNLGWCFTEIKEELDKLISREFDQPYLQAEFVGEPGHMISVAVTEKMQAKWLDPNTKMYVAVTSPLTSTDCERLLTGKLNMKIASGGRSDHLYRAGSRGLAFKYDNKPHTVLPQPPNMTYFQIDRDIAPEEWAEVKKTLVLTVRLNEKLFAEDPNGHTQFALKAPDGKVVRMGFTLFVVPPSASQSE